MKIIFLLFVCLVAAAAAQKKPAAVAPPAPSATERVFPVPLPLAERDRIRDLQHENDQIEIENQKMLLKIEQNRARQAALVDQMTIVATDFARSKNLDLAEVELDPATLALRKKKAK